MRNVNLAHGSLYLLGGYIGLLRRRGDRLFRAGAGGGLRSARRWWASLMQVAIFRFMPGQDLRQTMVTIGLSIIIADLLMWGIGATGAPDERPGMAGRSAARPAGDQRLLEVPDGAAAARHRHRRAAVAVPQPHAHRHDDPRRRGRPRHARGHRASTSIWCSPSRSPSAPASPASAASSARSSCRWCPGEDVRLLLASLIVVIVGGMGSVVGAAVGATILGTRRNLRPRLRADLQRGVHLRHPGAGARVPAARNPGTAGMSAAELAQGDELRARRRGELGAWRRVAAAGARRTPGAEPRRRRCRESLSAPRPGPPVRRLLRRRPRCAARLSVGGESVRHLPDRRAGAGARPDRAVAHFSRRLRRHDFAGADDGGRASPATWSASSARAAPPRSAWAGRGGSA